MAPIYAPAYPFQVLHTQHVSLTWGPCHYHICHGSVLFAGVLLINHVTLLAHADRMPPIVCKPGYCYVCILEFLLSGLSSFWQRYEHVLCGHDVNNCNSHVLCARGHCVQTRHMDTWTRGRMHFGQTIKYGARLCSPQFPMNVVDKPCLLLSAYFLLSAYI